jgi:ERCC4-type nuclease
MKELRQKIKHLDASMNQNNKKIHEQCHILKNYVRSSKFLIMEIGSSFIVGYFIARKRSIAKVIGTLVSLFFSAYKIQKKLNIFSK